MKIYIEEIDIIHKLEDSYCKDVNSLKYGFNEIAITPPCCVCVYVLQRERDRETQRKRERDLKAKF